MERRTAEGERPVPEIQVETSEIRSRPRHVEPWPKEGGPPPKAKYYSVTDSA